MNNTTTTASDFCVSTENVFGDPNENINLSSNGRNRDTSDNSDMDRIENYSTTKSAYHFYSFK